MNEKYILPKIDVGNAIVFGYRPALLVEVGSRIELFVPSGL